METRLLNLLLYFALGMSSCDHSMLCHALAFFIEAITTLMHTRGNRLRLMSNWK